MLQRVFWYWSLPSLLFAQPTLLPCGGNSVESVSITGDSSVSSEHLQQDGTANSRNHTYVLGPRETDCRARQLRTAEGLGYFKAEDHGERCAMVSATPTHGGLGDPAHPRRRAIPRRLTSVSKNKKFSEPQLRRAFQIHDGECSMWTRDYEARISGSYARGLYAEDGYINDHCR